MVKIRIPTLEEAKESKKLIIPPLFLITVLLLSSIVGVYYFHGTYDIKDLSNKYNKNWFEENNRAKIPKDLAKLFENLSDLTGSEDLVEDYPELENPEELLSDIWGNKTDFYAIGSVPPLVWKLTSLTVYLEGEGWKLATVDIEDYTPVNQGLGSFTFTLVKENISVDESRRIYLLSLWYQYDYFSVSGITLTNVYHNATTQPTISFDLSRDKKPDAAVLDISSSESALVSIAYTVEGSVIDEETAYLYSASISDTRNFAAEDPILYSLAELPENYLENHPLFADLSSSLYVGDDGKVFDQVKAVLNYLTINYDISSAEAPDGTDPVEWFIANGNGLPIYFLFTEALILRSYGIPARLAIGYIYGEYDEERDITFFNPANHIFVWLEVFDAGLNTWISFNGIPYPLPVTVQNLIDLSIQPELSVYAPRWLEGIPAVYLNETFYIVARIRGFYDPSKVGEMIIYDNNESTVIGVVPFTVDAEGLIAAFTATFEDIYNYLAKEPLYGRHVLTISIGSYVVNLDIALLERVSISP